MSKSTFLLWFVVLLFGGCTAIHHIKLSPVELRLLKKEKEIRAVHYEHYSVLISSSGNSIPINDPLIRVKGEFLKTLSNKLSLTNIRSIDEPRFGRSSIYTGAAFAPLKPLKRTFIKGLVFDFGSVEWELRMHAGLTFDLPKRLYSLRYSVHVRAIRVESNKIIWQGTCNIGKDTLGIPEYGAYIEPKENWLTEIELRANDNELLKVKRDEAADICVKQLLNQFFREENGNKVEQ